MKIGPKLMRETFCLLEGPLCCTDVIVTVDLYSTLS